MTEEILTEGLRAYGLNPQAAPTLEKYGTLLLAGNERMNLTAITDPDEAARRHMLDCAGILGAAEFADRNVLDVGSGAGFPGLVLKICCPSLSLTALDSLKKRTDWLRETADALQLPVNVVHGRAEELSRSADWRESFDLVTARAVADLRVLAELCLPYLRLGGVFLAMKSENCDAEIDAARNAVEILGGDWLPIYEYDIPGTALHRRAVRIQKVKATPPAYPRRFAHITRAPL